MSGKKREIRVTLHDGMGERREWRTSRDLSFGYASRLNLIDSSK